MANQAWWRNVDYSGSRILARKGSVNLMVSDNGLYSVERITRACGYTMKCGRNKQEIVDYFNEAIKGVRRSKYDMNLNVYARQ